MSAPTAGPSTSQARGSIVTSQQPSTAMQRGLASQPSEGIASASVQKVPTRNNTTGTSPSTNIQSSKSSNVRYHPYDHRTAGQEVKQEDSPGEQGLDLRQNGDIEPRSVSILKMIPISETAREEFSDLVLSNAGRGLDPHHGQFLVVTGKAELSSRDPAEIYNGHYCITTDSRTISGDPSFAVGRGIDSHDVRARNIDIPIATANSDRYRRIEPTAFFIATHEVTGALLMKPSTAGMIFNNQDISEGTSKAIPLGVSQLRFGDYHFDVDYAIKTVEAEQAYLRARRRRYLAEGWPLPSIKSSGVPMKSSGSGLDINRQGMLRSDNSGLCHEVIDKETGDLTIRKVTRVDQVIHANSVNLEVRVLNEIERQTGIRVYSQLNRERRGNGALLGITQIFSSIDYPGGVTFQNFNWASLPYKEMTVRTVTRQALRQLSVMHNNSWYHQNILPCYLMVIAPSRDPTTIFVNLIDIMPAGNKAVNWTEPSPESLAHQPTEYFALNADGQTPNNLSPSKVDMYRFGYSAASSFYRGAFIQGNADGSTRALDPKSSVDFVKIQTNLSATGSELARFLGGLMSWEAALRPEAEVALKHHVFFELDTINARISAGMTPQTGHSRTAPILV